MVRILQDKEGTYVPDYCKATIMEIKSEEKLNHFFKENSALLCYEQ